MNYTCRNCKNRHCAECVDYNFGFWDVVACRDGFSLDIETLSPEERKTIINIAEAILNKEGE